MKSLLLIGDFDIPADYLQSFRVTHCSTAKAKRLDAGFIQKLNHAQAIIYRTACPFMPEVLIQAPKLRYIVKAGSGLGGVDLEYCRRRNIKVANVAGANSRSVVELALWQALSLARFSCLFGNQPDMLGEELASKSAVVYGFGHIGRQLGQLLEAFGMTVTACGRESSAAQLLGTADYLFITASLNPSSYGAIGSHQLGAAKPGLRIAAISPAEILDQSSVLSDLESGQITALALDCIWLESNASQLTQIKSLQAQGRLIVTERLGASTLEARQRTSLAAVQRLLALIAEPAESSI